MAERGYFAGSLSLASWLTYGSWALMDRRCTDADLSEEMMMSLSTHALGALLTRLPAHDPSRRTRPANRD